MKTYFTKTVASLAFAGFIGAAINQSSAQVLAYDDAAPYTTWTNGLNSGYGFGPWVLRQTTNGWNDFSGFFIGNNGDPVASTNGNAWGLYANGSSGTNAAVAYRSFTNSLTAGTVFKIKWHTKGIGYGTDQLGGFNLRHGNTNGTTDEFDAGSVFDFYYRGGGIDAFMYRDFSGDYPVTVANGPIGFTTMPFDDNPFEVNFILTSDSTYRVLIKDISSQNLLTSWDGNLLETTIDSLSLYAFQTDGDQVFNGMEISSVSLVPPEIVNVYPTNGSIYVPFSNHLSFDVVSSFSTISTNGFTVLLNGVIQTNLTVIEWDSSYRIVFVDAMLPDNQVNTAVLIAADDNGNRVTNTVTFNTFSANNPFIEAGDYNFNAGRWIDNFATAQPNQAYRGSRTITNIVSGSTNIEVVFNGLFGSNHIDYLEYDWTGANNAYRPNDLPQSEICNDVDHHHFWANYFDAYDLCYNRNGEWEDYTRQMSNVTYNVYARMAGFGENPVMLLERLASPVVTSTNQPRAALGAFFCPPDTGGVQNFTSVPLTDLFGNPVSVRLPGTNTFRTTCVGSGYSYNFAYLIFVPSTNDSSVRPYISVGSPAVGSQILATNPPITFTIANAQSAVLPETIQVVLNDSNVTAGLIWSSNAAGTVVNFQPVGTMVPLNSTNILRLTFSDGAVMQTNQWQFSVADLPRVLNFSETVLATNPVNATVRVAFNANVYNGRLPTTVFFYFGLTTNYGGVSGPVATGTNSSTIPVIGWADGLSQGFTYHYSCVVSNAEGMTTSLDRTFAVAGAGVGATNSPPQISDFPDVSTGINTPTTPLPFTVSDAETPAASLSVSASAARPNLVPANGFVFGDAGSNRTLTITPASGQRGRTTIMVNVCDGATTTSKAFMLSVGVIPGDTNDDGIVGENELNEVLAAYWPTSPWLYMTNVAGLGCTNVTFALTNAIAGQFSVEVSTNLANWQKLGTATPRFEFFDPLATNAPERFYRLHWP
jgi:hypothetical protein